jgi:hypothetical protein
LISRTTDGRILDELFGQQTGAAIANIGQSIDVGWNGSLQEFPHQSIAKMVAILFYQIVVGGAKVRSYMIQRLIQFFGTTIVASHFELKSKFGTGSLSGSAFKDAAPASKGIFASIDFDSRMMKSKTNGKEIIIGGAQIVHIEKDFGFLT